MMPTLFSPLTIAGMSHHSVSAIEMERARFVDESEFLLQAREWFRGVVLLQTCNRVEVMVQGQADTLAQYLEHLERENFTLYRDTEALAHLLELAAGIDSMVIGEDQILGQLRKALELSVNTGVSSPILEFCVNKAIHTGVDARRKTQINRGAVSVGSAAVQLAEAKLGTLEGKHILVIGSGEMGILVTQALAAMNLSAIYVANRTFDRAKVLADKVGGNAVPMSNLYQYLALSDVVICCTSAPHPVIRKSELAEAMERRAWPLEKDLRPLIIVDIAQPRDVEEGAEEIPGISLFSIDNLREVTDKASRFRREAAEKVRIFLDEELKQFIRQYNRRSADETLGSLHTWAETIRCRERDRALARLPGQDDKVQEVIEDLSRALTRKILADVTMTIRGCAEQGDIQQAERIVNAITKGDRLCTQKKE